MEEYDDFTEEERKQISDMARREYQDLTPDEIELLTRWRIAQALLETEYQARLEAIGEESAAKLEQSRREHEAALQNMEELKQAALDFYESTFPEVI